MTTEQMNKQMNKRFRDMDLVDFLVPEKAIEISEKHVQPPMP